MTCPLEKLNTEQHQAVTHDFNRPALIIAPAGSGKTSTMCHRIAHMIRNRVPPGAIIALTFTNKAAREMRVRTLALLPPDSRPELTITTFHAWALRLLREYGHVLGYHGDGLTVYDKSRLLSVMRSSLATVRGTAAAAAAARAGPRQRTVTELFQTASPSGGKPHSAAIAPGVPSVLGKRAHCGASSAPVLVCCACPPPPLSLPSEVQWLGSLTKLGQWPFIFGMNWFRPTIFLLHRKPCTYTVFPQRTRARTRFFGSKKPVHVHRFLP